MVKAVEKSELVRRIERVLAGKNLKARQWSLEATGSADAVRNILRGRSRSPGVDTLRKLARAADISVSYLTLESDDMTAGAGAEYVNPSDIKRGQIEMLGYVGAGDQVYHFGPGELGERIEAPPGVERGAAAIVQGESMLPVYRPGETIIVEAYSGDLDDLVGRDCLVQIHEGPLYLKRLRKASRGRAWLESYANRPLMSNQPVDWIAPVVWVKRR